MQQETFPRQGASFPDRARRGLRHRPCMNNQWLDAPRHRKSKTDAHDRDGLGRPIDNVTHTCQKGDKSKGKTPMSPTTVAVEETRHSSLVPMIIIGVLFFIFGFVTWLNGPLITFVKLAFNLDDVNAFLVPKAFYLSYFFLALPSSFILKKTGMKKGMGLGLFVMAIGAVMFGQFVTMRV